MGALDQAAGREARDAAVAHRPQHRRIPRRSVAVRSGDRDDRRVGRRRRRRRPRRRRAAAATFQRDARNGPTASPISSSAWRRASRFRPTGPDFTPEEIVDPKLTEDRYVKWVQIIPTRTRAVHHSHVYVDLPEGTDTRRPRARHGIERRQRDGSDRVRRRQRRRHLPRRHDEDPEEGIALPLRVALSSRTARRPSIARRSASSSIRRASCRSTSSPRTASAPASATTGCSTASASKTCCCARATSSSIDEPTMPTGALDRGESAARRGVPEHSAQHRGAARALLAAAEAGADHQLPAAHALPRLAHACSKRFIRTAGARC